MSAPAAKPPPDVPAEQELDLGRVWRSVLSRWWLLLIGFIVGAIIGLLVSLGGGKQWKATTEVYLGQPLAANGSAPVTSPPTSLGLATAYINSTYALRRASKASGVPVSRLSGNISVKPIPAPLMQLSVVGSKAGKTQIAAQELGNLVVAQFQPYPSQKIKILQADLARDQAQVADINRRLTAAQNAQSSLAGSAANQALVASYAQVISTLSNERFAFQSDITAARSAIAQARGIEMARIVSPALSVSQGGPSRRSGVVIGAIIGLVIGFLVAVLWEPVAAQVRSHQNTA